MDPARRAPHRQARTHPGRRRRRLPEHGRSSEHIYGDQAAMLAQTRLLDAETGRRLPVIAAPEDVLEGRSPLNRLAEPRP
ncbi:hypothetical protein [Streptomyces sp. 7N604]|uniref:hypothetical protein n=1 Tax=Streptomyces sp. 7N604 TaxID=3457415 RepID=UPI003FD52719